MHLNELSDRSPVRIFEQSIHGGLGVGNIGVVVARHGVGKTAFLVGVALDDLFRGRKVLHVAIGKTIEHVREFYDEVFMDLARSAKLEDIPRVRRDMERYRHIKSYLGRSFTLDHVKDHVKMLREVLDFAPAALIVDGFDFEGTTTADLRALRDFARDLKCELWMSATTHRESKRDEQGIPEPVAHVKDEIAVVVQMAHDGKTVHLRLLKDHDNPAVSEVGLALDPTTMLLVKV